MVETTLFGSLVLAEGTIMENVNLRKGKFNIKLSQTLSFLTITAIMIPLLFFFWRVDAPALEIRNVIIFGLVIVFSAVANILTFYSIKWEKITNIEPAKMMEPLFVILLAIVFSFFTEGLYNKSPNITVAALVASVALIFSHIRKHHLNFNKYFVAAIFGSLFFALELVTSRLILDYYSPLSFYFIRCAAIFLFSIIAFRPRFSKLESGAKKEILIVAVLWVVYRLMIY